MVRKARRRARLVGGEGYRNCTKKSLSTGIASTLKVTEEIKCAGARENVLTLLGRAHKDERSSHNPVLLPCWPRKVGPMSCGVKQCREETGGDMRRSARFVSNAGQFYHADALKHENWAVRWPTCDCHLPCYPAKWEKGPADPEMMLLRLLCQAVRLRRRWMHATHIVISEGFHAAGLSYRSLAVVQTAAARAGNVSAKRGFWRSVHPACRGIEMLDHATRHRCVVTYPILQSALKRPAANLVATVIKFMRCDDGAGAKILGNVKLGAAQMAQISAGAGICRRIPPPPLTWQT